MSELLETLLKPTENPYLLTKLSLLQNFSFNQGAENILVSIYSNYDLLFSNLLPSSLLDNIVLENLK